MSSPAYSIEQIIAGSYVDLVQRIAAADPNRPISVIIQGLNPDEIRRFLSLWLEVAGIQPGLIETTVVVSKDVGARSLPKPCIVSDDSVFTFTKSCQGGLIYFASNRDLVDPPPRGTLLLSETKGPRKSTGHYSEFTDLLINHTAKSIGFEDQIGPPEVHKLLRLIYDVTDTVNTQAMIRFCYDVLQDIYGRGTDVAPEDTEITIGRHLPVLGYFPDEQWQTHASAEGIKRRLEQNANHVHLLDELGNQVERRRLGAACRERHFRNLSGVYYPESDQTHWRNLLERYFSHPMSEIRNLLPYHIVHQVFINYQPKDLSDDMNSGGIEQCPPVHEPNNPDQEYAVSDQSQNQPIPPMPIAPSDTNFSEPGGSDTSADLSDGPEEPLQIQQPSEPPHSQPEREVPIDLQFERTVLDTPNLNPSRAGRGAPLTLAELLRRYQLILDTYSQFGVSVLPTEQEVDRFVEGPASVLYRVKPDEGVDPKKLQNLSDSLKLVLKLEAEQNLMFRIDRGFVTIDVPKSEEDRYFVTARELWSKWMPPGNALSVPLGLDTQGNAIDINFSSSDSPHLLIAGTTGSGKSEALNTILGGLVRHYMPEQLRLMLVDPKGTELMEYESSPYLEGKIGWSDSDANSLLINAFNEMQRRYEIFVESGARNIQDYNSAARPVRRLPWWLVVLDEYADLTADRDMKREIEGSLGRLAQKARAAGIHIVIATQKPSGDVISTNLRSNLPAQLALRVKSGIESRVVMDETGAESLNGKGDAFLKCLGRITRIQCAKM
ncbi:MAG: DNA translocase FtsK [Gemmatimonadota bacterium]|nr:DNA translocase FtsK [Gemmatimonadota bacterium]